MVILQMLFVCPRKEVNKICMLDFMVCTGKTNLNLQIDYY